jgi:hypothetical protein
MDFRAFHVITMGMEDVLKAFFFEAQGGADSSAQAATGAVELKILKQSADFFSQFTGWAERK